MIPYFENNNYTDGILAGIDAIKRILAGPSKLERLGGVIILATIPLLFLISLFPGFLGAVCYLLINAAYWMVCPIAFLMDLIR